MEGVTGQEARAAGQRRERRLARDTLPLGAPALVSANEEMPTPDPTALKRAVHRAKATLESMQARATLCLKSSTQRLFNVIKARTNPRA